MEHICIVKVIGAAIGFLLLAICAMAQYPYYHNITTEEGLPSNEVYSVIKDANSFIWIGSDVGLVRYNGISFKQYKNKAQKSRVIAGLVLSPSGSIYGYNFSNQVFKFENDSLHELVGLNKGVTNIAVDSIGQLWVSGNDGIYLYREHENDWTRFDSTVQRSRGVMVDHRGDVWFLDIHKNRVGNIRNGTSRFYEIHHSVKDFQLATYNISAGPNGVWLLSVDAGKLFKLGSEAFEQVSSKSINDAIIGRKFNHFLQLPDGRLWLFSFDGVVVYDPSEDHTEVLYKGVSFSNCIIGSEGGLWLTSLHKGLFYIPDMRFRNWGTVYGALPSKSITRLYLYNNFLYFATFDGYFGSLNLKDYTIKNQYVGNSTDINGLYYDSVTQLLHFNSSTNIYNYKSGELTIIEENSPPIKCILRVADKVFYAASFGLYAADNNIIDSSLHKLFDTWFRDLLYNSSTQQLWAAGDDGIKIVNAITESVDTALLSGTQVVAIAQNKEQVFALLYTGQIVAIDQNFGTNLIATLPNEANGADLEIGDGKIIVATNQGLLIYNLTTESWLKMDKVMGLASNDVKVVKQYKDQLWIATGNGLQTIPLHYDYDKPKARVYLTGLAINGKPFINQHQTLTLKYGDVMSFVPEAVTYSSMGKYQYAYQVLQRDTAWQILPASTQQFSLPNIAPGPFTFQLKVIDHAGRDSENIISVVGYMEPPFWQRWWFYVLLSAAGVLLAFIGFRYRLRTIKQKQQQELDRVQLENELELSQQAALKAQMNPHFIFNVLNSIKSYIYENDKKSAAEYLSTFANLIRRILIMSGEANVSLEEELDALRLYIELEAMLLAPPFEYTINIEPEIELHHVRLPSLLIQPYIENAFKHGLRHQEGAKQLTLSITKENEILKIVIEDNGVGRLAAERLNKDRIPGHQSFASNANSKRLALLNKNLADSIDVELVDKTGDDNKPAGTTVIITVKIS